ncbi:MAG: NAD(P)-binding domain-containing protein [Proteobacteria bacterium]|nr:NAD(P)-binding domain-containing protein [Pseudomonadota bacterium]
MLMKFSSCMAVIFAAIIVASISASLADSVESEIVIAIIGTGDMGDSLGPRFTELGYSVVYGSRYPDSEKAQRVLKLSGPNARVTTQREAAQAGDIVVLAVPWPAMATVAQNLGSLDGKIVIDISFPHRQADDGYYESMVETSSAEMIQQWNPGARVLKTFALQASYVIDDPGVVGGPVSIPIASDDREAKEQVAAIIVAMGLDPIDAGPLRFARELEAMQRLYGVPFFQRRAAAWEFYFRRSYFWECIWEDDWSDPVADADDLADVPETQGPAMACPGTR